MKGWQIVLHSVRQVTGNIEEALRISAIPYLILSVGGFLLLYRMEKAAVQAGTPPDSFVVGLALIASVLLSLWIAVAWHRFVLLNERPSGFLPIWRGSRIWAYFLQSFGYALIIVLCGAIWAVIVVLAVGRIGATSPILISLLLAILIQIPLMTLFLRLAAALPASALGESKGFLGGWTATGGHTGDIAIVAVIAAAASVCSTLVYALLPSGLWILALAWQFIAGWLGTMIGISILTTLYGHYVEGRPLV